MEARREIAVAPPTVSPVLSIHGRIVERTNEFTAASTVVAAAALQITPEFRRPWIDRLLAAAGLLCCVLAAGARGPCWRRQPMRQDGPDISPDSATAEGTCGDGKPTRKGLTTSRVARANPGHHPDLQRIGEYRADRRLVPARQCAPTS